MVRVLDSHALLAYLEKEPGFEAVQSVFLHAVEKESPVLMTAVNFGEVYYVVMRELGSEKAVEIEHVIGQLPIQIVGVDIDLAREAAKFKAAKKMSYADCFAAALAKLHGGELITGDKEFKEVERDVKVLWIR